MRYQLTDRPTDRLTDTVCHRDDRTHLKLWSIIPFGTIEPKRKETFKSDAGGSLFLQVAFGQPSDSLGTKLYLKHLPHFISASVFGGVHLTHCIVGQPQASLPTIDKTSP